MALVQQPQQSQLLAPVLGQSSPVQYAGLFQKHFMHYLLVLKQQSAAEERITKNGIQKTVHVVVKNSPFIVVVGQNPEVPLSFDLSRVAFDCALVYDTDDESTPKVHCFSPLLAFNLLCRSWTSLEPNLWSSNPFPVILGTRFPLN